MGTFIHRVRRVKQAFDHDPVAARRRVANEVRRRVWAVTSTHRVSRDLVTPPGGPGQQAFNRFAGRHRFRKGNPTVVVITDPSVRRAVPNWIAQFPRARVLVLATATVPGWRLAVLGADHIWCEDVEQPDARLKEIGPIDVVIDLIPHSAEQQRILFHRLFWHIKPGGIYVLDPAVSGRKQFSARVVRWIASILASADSTVRPTSARHKELGRAISRVYLGREVICIEKRLRHYLRLRDAETNRTLPLREPSLELNVLERLPAATLVSRTHVVSHEASIPIGSLDDRMPYPELYVRHYRGQISMVGNQLLYTGSTILPDSFRYTSESNPRNSRVTRVGMDFARLSQKSQPKEILHGNYYHLDSENSGHFGHLMTEQLSRLWGWHHAKREIPDLKLIFRVRRANYREPKLEKQIFGAFGIASQDIVWIDRPMLLESVVAATPMWHDWNPYYVHPEIKPRVWDPLAEALIDESTETYEKIFVSRREYRVNRTCRNARRVEQLFADHGFTIIYPESHGIGEQAAIFSKARVIAGFGGSGMFNVLFAANLVTMIVLAHESYTTRNEHLFASVLGCESHYFWSLADVTQPATGWSGPAFFSGWDFDFARNGADLTKLLETL